jgi:hypothetical protein
LFHKGKKSDKQRKGAVATSATSGLLTGQGNNTGSAVAMAETIPGSNNLLQVPGSAYDPSQVSINNSYPVDDDEETDSEDDEAAAILGSGTSGKAGFSVPGGGVVGGRQIPSTSNTIPTTSMESDPSQNTFIQDGVHVTSL